MLGRHHISLTFATVLPFIIPFFFITSETDFVTYGIVFLFAAIIGALVPDADCKGNSRLYYRFEPIDWLMKKIIIRFTIWILNKSKVKSKIGSQYFVSEEHRGIMHAPLGVIMSSLLLTLFFYLGTMFLNITRFSSGFIVFLLLTTCMVSALILIPIQCREFTLFLTQIDTLQHDTLSQIFGDKMSNFLLRDIRITTFGEAK